MKLSSWLEIGSDDDVLLTPYVPKGITGYDDDDDDFFHISFVNACASNLHNGWIKFPYIFVCVCVYVKISQYRVLPGEYSGNNSSLQVRPINSAFDSATCVSVLALVALDTNFLSMYSLFRKHTNEQQYHMNHYRGVGGVGSDTCHSHFLVLPIHIYREIRDLWA